MIGAILRRSTGSRNPEGAFVVQDQSLHEAPQPLSRIAANFAAMASGIHARQPDAALGALFEETQRWCEQAASERSAEQAVLLANLTTALTAWQQVWPRLGAQPEFRQAVAREADLWSKRLQALAATGPSGGAGSLR